MMNAAMIQNLTEDVLQKLDAAENEMDFRKILAENGVAGEEIDRFVDYLKNAPEETDAELSVDALEDVAGGGPTLQRYIAKWAYRAKHGKWFVKTTYDADSRTITATNRFGDAVSETYMY